jgi:hypothetical protein
LAGVSESKSPLGFEVIALSTEMAAAGHALDLFLLPTDYHFFPAGTTSNNSLEDISAGPGHETNSGIFHGNQGRQNSVKKKFTEVLPTSADISDFICYCCRIFRIF